MGVASESLTSKAVWEALTLLLHDSESQKPVVTILSITILRAESKTLSLPQISELKNCRFTILSITILGAESETLCRFTILRAKTLSLHNSES